MGSNTYRRYTNKIYVNILKSINQFHFCFLIPKIVCTKFYEITKFVNFLRSPLKLY